jgi:hypothetical protein
MGVDSTWWREGGESSRARQLEAGGPLGSSYRDLQLDPRTGGHVTTVQGADIVTSSNNNTNTSRLDATSGSGDKQPSVREEKRSG